MKTIEELRDELIDMAEQHTRICADPHCTWPLGAVAFFAHSLGIRSDGLAELREMLAHYEATCEGCSHIRN